MPSLSLSLVCSGLVLAILAPLTMIEIGSSFYSIGFLTHLTFLALAVYISVTFFMRLILRQGFFAWLLLGLLLVLLGWLCLIGLLPITPRDALLYHLAVPKWWLAAGRMIEVPWHEWSYFPLLQSLAYAGFLSWNLEQAIPFYPLCYLVIIAGLTGQFIFNQSKDSQLAVFSYIFILVIPLFLRLGISPMADLAMLAYFACAFNLLVGFVEEKRSKFDLVLAGLALGLCLSTKYNSLLAVGLLLALLAIYFIRNEFSQRQTLGYLSLIVLFCSIVFCFWPLRNIIWANNPVYPFLQSVFSDGDNNVAFMGGVKPLSYRMQVYGESLVDILLIPVRMLFSGEDDNPANFDGVLTPFLLLGVIPLFSRINKSWFSLAFQFSFLYFTLSLLLFYALVRYQAPTLFVLVLLSSFGISKVATKLKIKLQYACFAILLFQLALSFLYLDKLDLKLKVWPYLSGEHSRHDYLSSQLMDYDTIDYINRNLPENSKVYLLFTGNKFYYFEKEARGSYFSANKILAWLKQSENLENFLDKLAKENFTHIMLHRGRTTKVFKDSLDFTKLTLWGDFLTQSVNILHQDKSYSLLEIKAVN